MLAAAGSHESWFELALSGISDGKPPHSRCPSLYGFASSDQHSILTMIDAIILTQRVDMQLHFSIDNTSAIREG